MITEADIIGGKYRFIKFMTAVILSMSLFIAFIGLTNVLHGIGITPRSMDMLLPVKMQIPNDCTPRKMMQMSIGGQTVICVPPTKAENIRYAREKDRQQEAYLKPLTIVADICLALWVLGGFITLLIILSARKAARAILADRK